MSMHCNEWRIGWILFLHQHCAVFVVNANLALTMRHKTCHHTLHTVPDAYFAISASHLSHHLLATSLAMRQ